MLDKERIPTHVAIIMDGNGRWAKQKNLPKIVGHNAGMKAMKEIVKSASSLGIKFLTVYAFSTENWKRSEEEVGGIFKLLISYAAAELEELNANNVRVEAVGDISALPPDALASIKKAMGVTARNDGLRLNVALNYGARAEICNALRSLGGDVRAGTLEPEDIDEDLISSRLYSNAAGIPDPELLIRTSGEKRVSNFLLWQIAYSEMVFTDVLWPDFTPEEFEKCIEEYQGRDRRFGGRK